MIIKPNEVDYLDVSLKLKKIHSSYIENPTTNHIIQISPKHLLIKIKLFTKSNAVYLTMFLIKSSSTELIKVIKKIIDRAFLATRICIPQ